MDKQLIYGDIGGTKTILQIATLREAAVHVQFTYHYNSNAYTTFSDLLRDFLDRSEIKLSTSASITACFAIAGPVVGQKIKMTNLPWQIDSTEIKSEFSMSSVQLLNDFEAAALAIEILSPEDLTTLQTGQVHAQEMCVILGAGTGMGVAWLTWQGDRYVPLSTEAGHMDFAPTGKLQIKLLEALQNKFDHVSIERVLSGPGLTNIFNFLQTELAAVSNLARKNLNEDSGATITALALTHHHPIALKSLELFTEIYGAYAGNLALAGLCRNGVYIAGGIAPKIINILNTGRFIQAFRDKGRFSAMMHEIPVHVITNPEVNLLGARQEAQRIA
ncbi:MAG: glucokinase [Betaproteobacteria bacterium]|nr:glucokinase [Betaproteobacteria bacterium]